uniref:Si:ch211-154o6.3 n=1 Tax=Acanthochromis polyacanthus TaxID=80966 RepID=A0A3Q1H5H7_9TELE
MGEVRKLQKKLRQIETLEIKISLTAEERFKISRKAELRSRLAQLQLQLSGPQQTLGIVGDGKKEKMKRQVLIRVEELCRLLSQYAYESTLLTAQIIVFTEAEFTSLKASWEKSRFRLRLLEGHSDIVTCVVAVDNLVVSGSRDTTVKVWHVPTATEQKNLGGHTGGVTCLSAPPPEYCTRLARSLSLSTKERFILSGSADCYVKIWALNIGQCVKSIYTFNAVTALCFVPEEGGYIITGSDGGKVQAWSWHSFQNCQSVNAHQEAVTSIQSQGPLVFSGSAEGGVSVWENRCSDRDPLTLLHHWSSQVTGFRGRLGGRLTLSPRGDKVFLAYGQAWLKILHWRTGATSRVTNHSDVTGVTDCVHQTGGLLIGSCYDLANGESTLNLFSLPQCQYLVSLTWPDAPRILCFAAWTTGSGDHRWVIGGHNLTVLEQLPSSGKQRCTCTAKTQNLTKSVYSRSDRAEDGGSGSWLRCVLQ